MRQQADVGHGWISGLSVSTPEINARDHVGDKKKKVQVDGTDALESKCQHKPQNLRLPVAFYRLAKLGDEPP